MSNSVIISETLPLRDLVRSKVSTEGFYITKREDKNKARTLINSYFTAAGNTGRIKSFISVCPRTGEQLTLHRATVLSKAKPYKRSRPRVTHCNRRKSLDRLADAGRRLL